MPGENIEVLDDFILDMDIETITLDDMELKEAESIGNSLDVQKAAELAAENNFQIEHIENLNFSGPFGESGGFAPGITQQADTIQISSPNNSIYVASAEASSDVSAEAPIQTQPSAQNQPQQVQPEFTENPVALETEEIRTTAQDINIGSIDFMESVQEPDIPIYRAPEAESDAIDNESPVAPAASVAQKEPVKPETTPTQTTAAKFESEDDIISIDGNDLDRLIYGEETSTEPSTSNPAEEYEVPEPPVMFETPDHIDDVIVIEEPVPGDDAISYVDVPQENLLATSDLEQESLIMSPEASMPEPDFSIPEAPMIEDIQMPDNSVIEPLELPETPDENFELIIDEESPIEGEIHYTSEPTEVLETEEPEPSTPPAAEDLPEFNFDLSVIPDVAEIEEDEPIALSMDELNNIDISGNVIEFAAPQVEETVEEMVQPLSNQVAMPETPMDLPPEAPVEPEAVLADESAEERSQIIQEKLANLSPETKDELKTVLLYLDQLLENLPEDKIRQFANSDYYDLYVKLLDRLGI